MTLSRRALLKLWLHKLYINSEVNRRSDIRTNAGVHSLYLFLVSIEIIEFLR